MEGSSWDFESFLIIELSDVIGLEKVEVPRVLGKGEKDE